MLPNEAITRLQTGDGKPLFLIEGPNGSYNLTPYDPTFAQKMAKAKGLFKQASNDLESQLGADHPQTLRAKAALAKLT
ncbi:MAG: hypothetical protein ABJC66_13355 [Gammaproteobacteria bacterium]